MKTSQPDGVEEAPPRGGKLWLGVVVIAGVMVLISGGVWGWQHARAGHPVPEGSRPVVWLLSSGKIHGRVVEDLTTELKTGPGGVEVVLEVKGRWSFHSESKTAGPAFLMMDAQDRIYAGSPSGEIQGWDGASPWLPELSANKMDRAGVQAAYEKETGKAWVVETQAKQE